MHLGWPLELVFAASAVVAAAGRRRSSGVAAARLRGPYLAGATLMLAVALPVGGRPVPGRVRRRPGPVGHHHHARLPRGHVPADPVAGLGDLRRRADHLGPAGQPGPQPGRPQLAGGPRRRGRRRAGRPQRGPAAGAGVRGQRRPAPGSAAALLAVVTGIVAPGRLHPDPVHRAAHRGRAGRPRQPARRGLGQPGAGPGADLPHQRGHQPRPVQGRPAPACRSPPTASCSSSSCSCSPRESRAASAVCSGRLRPRLGVARRRSPFHASRRPAQAR